MLVEAGLVRKNNNSARAQVQITAVQRGLIKRREVIFYCEFVLYRIQFKYAVSEVGTAAAEVESSVSGRDINKALTVGGGSPAGCPNRPSIALGSGDENSGWQQSSSVIGKQPAVIVECIASIGAVADIDVAIEQQQRRPLHLDRRCKGHQSLAGLHRSSDLLRAVKFFYPAGNVQ